jgi:hypothetical protein
VEQMQFECYDSTDVKKLNLKNKDRVFLTKVLDFIFHAGNVDVVPTAIVAAVQVSHFSHCGIVKSNIAALLVHELVTLASVPGSHVVVVQTDIVAAAHGLPLSHLSHFRSTLASDNVTVCESSLVNTKSSQTNAALTIEAHVLPVSHFAHLGIVKSNIAAEVVPELTTDAEVPASHVVVDHTVIVAAVPVSQVSHLSHLSHFSHSGIVKFSTAALEVQELVTLAEVQGSHVVVVPTVIVAAVPVSHFSHLRLEY